MRTIYLLRHAKTELAGPEMSDFDRALTARGQADAAAMGAHIQVLDPPPEVILCSTAVRARQTLEYSGLNLPTELQAKLYLASPGEILAAIQGGDDAAQSVLVIGHNPGLHELVVQLMDDADDEKDIEQLSVKYPTATLATLAADAASWHEVAPASCTLKALHIGRG